MHNIGGQAVNEELEGGGLGHLTAAVSRFDIQGKEYEAISAAIDWLIDGPPCCMLMEVELRPHSVAVLEVLGIVSDAAWTTVNPV